MQALRLPTVSARPAARPLRAPAPPRASAVAAPASIPIKGADGSDKGTAELALKVADPKTARHVVHRYAVQINQNARQVRSTALLTSVRWLCRGAGRAVTASVQARTSWSCKVAACFRYSTTVLTPAYTTVESTSDTGACA